MGGHYAKLSLRPSYWRNRKEQMANDSNLWWDEFLHSSFSIFCILLSSHIHIHVCIVSFFYYYCIFIYFYPVGYECVTVIYCWIYGISFPIDEIDFFFFFGNVEHWTFGFWLKFNKWFDARTYCAVIHFVPCYNNIRGS